MNENSNSHVAAGEASPMRGGTGRTASELSAVIMNLPCNTPDAILLEGGAVLAAYDDGFLDARCAAAKLALAAAPSAPADSKVSVVNLTDAQRASLTVSRDVEIPGVAADKAEAVAVMVAVEDGLGTVFVEFLKERPPAGTLLYAAPPTALLREVMGALSPVETVRYWADEFAKDPGRLAGGMVIKLLNEYAKLREQLGEQT